MKKLWGALLTIALVLTCIVPTHATEQFANLAYTTLNGTITSGATSITVASSSGFPSGGTFRVKIGSEILLVTAVSGTTWTVTRGAESTTAAAHATGSDVRAILTAGALSQLETDVAAAADLLYVRLAGDLGGTRAAPTVASVTGSSGSVSMPATLTFSSGATVRASGGLAIDLSGGSTAVASQGALRSYFSQGWYSRNSANTGDTEVIGTNGGNSILVGSGSGTGASPTVFVLATTNIQLQPASTTRFLVDGSGVVLNATAGSYGGGAQVVFLGNRTTAPTSNPTGGGILYAESGEAIWRGSSGNVTSITGLRYGTYANRPSVPNQGATYNPSDGHSSWISDGTVWRPLVRGVVGTAPPAAASFSTSINVSSATIADSTGAVELTGLNDGGTTTFRGWAFAGTTSATGQFDPQPPGSVAASTFTVLGVFMRESSSSKISVCAITLAHNTQLTTLEYQHWTANTTRDVSTSYAISSAAQPIFLREKKSGSNMLCQYTTFAALDSSDTGWTTLNTTAVTSAFTSAPDQVGVMTMGLNAAPHGYLLSFLGN